MTNTELLLRLNFFYVLEFSQVNYYLTQARNNNNSFYKHVLLDFTEVEITHTKIIKKYIKLFGGTPTIIGNSINSLSGIFSKLISYTNSNNIFFYNYLLETLAFNDYLRFIKKLDINKKYRKQLINDLVNNMIDEDIHRSWFNNQRKR